MKVVLVGVNHAGTSFLRTLKSLDKNIEISAYDKNTDISFLGCGIALWVGGEFQDPKGLFYANKEILKNDFGTDVQMQHEVIEINKKEKYVMVKNLLTLEVFKDSYDKLVFAGGTWPITIPVEGHDLKNIFFSKIFAHAQEIHRMNHDLSVKNVVVLGAGYIGIELVEAFQKAGKKVTLIDMADRVIPRYFDPEFTSPMEEQMKKDNIHFASQEKLASFEGDENGNVTKVVTDKGSYDADMVIMAVGFRPQTAILKDKVEMTPAGAIIVNEAQISSDENIYAIGDSCSIHHTILGNAHVALATNAVKTGLVAAFNIAKPGSMKFPGVNGTNAISVFGFKYASTGVSEESCKAFNIKHKSVFIVDKDRPEFMHDAADVSFKLVYNPETLKILGAQIGSIEKNHTEVIYAISLAISEGKTIVDLALMDVFFLPHFNKPFNFMIKAVLEAVGLPYAEKN